VTTTYAARVARNRRQHYRRTMKAQGQWNPWFDASIVREHMAMLRKQGITLKRIAELSDTPLGEINSITYGTGRAHINKVRTEIAERILNLRPTWEGIPDTAFMPATGLTRRLQGLVAVGWPPPVLADRLVVQLTYLNRILRGVHPRVTGRFHRTVQALYDQLWNTDPANCGVNSALIKRAKARAHSHAWSLPAAWDDELIDDPEAQPSICDATPRYIALAENCGELERQGYTREQIAERLGVTRDGLQRALGIYRQKQAEVAAA
jgi:hypothetical protein